MSGIAMIVAVAAGCSLPSGWDTVDARGPRYVLLGEVHGTAEAPAATADIVCALAKRGERVLVALEQSADSNEALRAAFAKSATDFAAAAQAALGWGHPRSDGRESVAMLGLLQRLHALKAAGQPVHVMTFMARMGDGGQAQSEADDAARVRQVAAADRYDRVVVLVGATHVSTVEFVRPHTRFRPMAMHLAPAAERVSLNIIAGPGTVWGCRLKPGVQPQPGKPITGADMVCGAHPSRDGPKPGSAPRVVLEPQVETEGTRAFDGYLWLGSTTMSPPAGAGPSSR